MVSKGERVGGSLGEWDILPTFLKEFWPKGRLERENSKESPERWWENRRRVFCSIWMVWGWDRAGEQQADEKHPEKSLRINCKSPRGFQMGRDHQRCWPHGGPAQVCGQNESAHSGIPQGKRRCNSLAWQILIVGANIVLKMKTCL